MHRTVPVCPLSTIARVPSDPPEPNNAAGARMTASNAASGNAFLTRRLP